ncbi:hypothetical protein NFI96_006093 [Prochilodus magdalenae]|nr:hypothetical protein NFI96_006093 [Prochilodus magdalenae]
MVCAALSSVQEDVDSPRLVRRVDVSSQRHPPAVSEEDLSVASLLDIPSWAETMGHPHSESIHGDMLEELDITQDGFTNAWAAQEARAESTGKAENDEQVSSSFITSGTDREEVGLQLCLNVHGHPVLGFYRTPSGSVSLSTSIVFHVSFGVLSVPLSSPSSHPIPLALQLSPTPQEGTQTPLDHVDVCLSSSVGSLNEHLERRRPPAGRNQNFFDFSQVSIASFSKELSAQEPSNDGAHAPRGEEPERLEDSPLEDLSPVCEKSDIEGNEKSLSELAQSPLSESAEPSAVLESTSHNRPSGEPDPEDEQGSGRDRVSPLPVHEPNEGSPVDRLPSTPPDPQDQGGSQATPDLVKTPLESDYVFVDPDQIPDDPVRVTVEHGGSSGAVAFPDHIPVSQTAQPADRDIGNPQESSSVPGDSEFQDKYPAKSRAPPMDSPELMHPSEELGGDHAADVLSAPKPLHVQVASSGYTDDGAVWCEDPHVLRETTLPRDGSPFSVSDLSPQTPETVRTPQHFEFGEVRPEPDATEPHFVKDAEAARVPAKPAGDPQRPASESSQSESDNSAKASLVRSFSETQQTGTFSTDQTPASAEPPSEPAGSSSGATHSVLQAVTSESHSEVDPETMEVLDNPAESPSVRESLKASAGMPRVLPGVLQRPEDSDSETFFECRQAVSDYSEPEQDPGADVPSSCFGGPEPQFKTQGWSASSRLLRPFRGPLQSSGSEDYEDAPNVQEALARPQEEESEHVGQTMSPPFRGSPQELPPPGGAVEEEEEEEVWRDVEAELSDSSDEDVLSTRVVRRRVIIQGGGVPDLPPLPVTEEQYTDEQGNLVIKKGALGPRLLITCEGSSQEGDQTYA